MSLQVIYGCYTGVHLSLLAAGLHLGWFGPEDDLAACRKKIRIYASGNWREVDKPTFRGLDEKRRAVYTVGLTMERDVMTKAVNSLFALANRRDFHLVDVSSCGGSSVELGSKLAGFGFGKALYGNALFQIWGERLTEHGIARSLPAVGELVAGTKAYLDSVINLEND